MPITLYFDTATSANWLYREPPTDPRQPRMIRLAYLLAEDFGDELDSYCALVRLDPDCPPFGEVTVTSTGITREACEEIGTPLQEVIARFNGALMQANTACAYNTQFHWQVIRSSYGLLRPGVAMPLPAELAQLCAMRYCTDVVKKPRMKPGGGYQWPNQREAYFHFIGSELPAATEHDPIGRGLLVTRATRIIAEQSRLEKERV